MQIPVAGNRVHSWVLFVRNLCRERLQNVVHSVCGQKAITARKLLTPSDYVMPFKKLHRFHITCWAYLGFSWEPQKKILTFMHATPQLCIYCRLYFVCGDDDRRRERGCRVPSLVGAAKKKPKKTFTLMRHFYVVLIKMAFFFYDMKSQEKRCCFVYLFV